MPNRHRFLKKAASAGAGLALAPATVGGAGGGLGPTGGSAYDTC